jgi:hypothetical protein
MVKQIIKQEKAEEAEMRFELDPAVCNVNIKLQCE